MAYGDPDPLGQRFNQGAGFEAIALKPVKWEYKTVCISIINITSTLNQYGDEGWELVAIIGNEHTYAIMKRAKYGD